MQKSQLVKKLTEKHHSFVNYLMGLSDSELLSSNHQKWTAGQQLDHIYRSLRPLLLVLSLPKFLVKIVFGKANRPSRSYEELVARYQTKLAEGGRASGRFLPKTIGVADKLPLSRAVWQVANKLGECIEKYSEQELDTYILPHPLLGKLTLREMMYFTIYHVEHHHALTRQNLSVAN